MTGDVKKRQFDCGGIAAEPSSKGQLVSSGAAREDRISCLPRGLVKHILMRLPIHDVARTCILTKAWRNNLAMHPFLDLDSRFYSHVTSNKEENTHKSQLIKAFDMILSAHVGPILYAYLYITPVLRGCSHQWIEQLSDKGLESIYFSLSEKKVYLLPSALFRCPELTLLTLYNMVLVPSFEAGSFANLTKVQLFKITIARNMTFGTQLRVLEMRGCSGIERLTPQFTEGNNLQILSVVASTKIEWQWLECTTKLEYLGLVLTVADYKIMGVSKLIKLLTNIPTFSHLELDGHTLEVLGPPPLDLVRPTTKVVTLRRLALYGLKVHSFRQISNVVYMIRSFPNLQDICIELAPNQVKCLNPKESTMEFCLASLDWKNQFRIQLQTAKIKGVVYSRYVLHFIRRLLASSPALKVISLSCSTKIDNPKEKLMIKREVQKFPRLSLDAQVIWC